MISAKDLINLFQQALKDKWGYIWGTAGENWTAGKQKELEKTTDQDRALGRAYGSKWIGHKVADCSGLFSWAFRQLGGQMYHGSNTMYLKWCADKGELPKGRRSDGKPLKPGTAVFVWNGKKYSHVGLFIGGDTVIEALGTKAGVTTSKVSATKWTHWGELCGVDYDAAPGSDEILRDAQNDTAGAAASACHPEQREGSLLRKGSKGDAVREVQTLLQKKGYDLGKCGVDGDFGSATEKAVRQFQADHVLTVDGVAGPETRAALTVPGTNLYTVTIPHLTKFRAEAFLKDNPGAFMREE